MMRLLTNRYLIIALLLLSISACDAQRDAFTESKPASIEANQTEEKQVIALDDSASTNDAVAKVASITPTDHKVSCEHVRDMMAQIGNTSKIEDIYRVNEALPACLKTTDSVAALALLNNYDEMYNRFLDEGLQGEEDIHTFNDVAYKQETGEAVTKADYAALSPRLKYLLTLSRSKDDVYLKHLGEGYYAFGHDLSAMVSRFAPYLAKEDRIFFERMAKDNKDIFWNDAAITVSFEELIERALFWEDYLKRFANGHHAAEAKQLYDVYRYSLFFGSDNTDWTDDAMHYFIEPEFNWAMIELSHKPNSQLAKDAKKFLDFMQTSDDERRGDIELTDDEYQYISIARQRADEVMQIPRPWEGDRTMNCLSGIFCYED